MACAERTGNTSPHTPQPLQMHQTPSTLGCPLASCTSHAVCTQQGETPLPGLLTVPSYTSPVWVASSPSQLVMSACALTPPHGWVSWHIPVKTNVADGLLSPEGITRLTRNRLHPYDANRGCGREKEIEKHGQGGQRREKKVDTVTQPVRRERHGWDPAGA